MRYARDWGFGQLDVVNLYSFRATTPRELWRAADPVGPGNDGALATVVSAADLVVAAWGTQARPERLAELAPVLGTRPLQALGVTKGGAPRHPLYVRADVRPSGYSYSG